MDISYKEYFGFRQGPFNITADPEFLYLSRSHREALAQLSYGIKGRRGFVVLTGEVGTGKTTLIHTLLNELDGNTQTALIFSHISDPLDLLRYTCDDFGLKPPRQARTDLYEHLALLNSFLLEKYRSGGNCALIIDEAQNLSAEVLESVRLLSNFETSKDKLLQILLVGQPELSARLNSQELRQLKQRVTLRHHLRPLTLRECQEYIGSRLRVAGGEPTLFETKAMELVYAYSGGIPRVINVICDNGLLTAHNLNKNHVDRAVVRQVAEDLGISGTAFSMKTAATNGTSATTLKSEGATSFQPQGHAENSSRSQPAGDTFSSSVGPSLVIPLKFFDELLVLLVDAMGPMASIVLRERVASLGESLDQFPRDKLSALLDAVSHEILDPAMRRAFRQFGEERLGTLVRSGQP